MIPFALGQTFGSRSSFHSIPLHNITPTSSAPPPRPGYPSIEARSFGGFLLPIAPARALLRRLASSERLFWVGGVGIQGFKGLRCLLQHGLTISYSMWPRDGCAIRCTEHSSESCGSSTGNSSLSNMSIPRWAMRTSRGVPRAMSSSSLSGLGLVLPMVPEPSMGCWVGWGLET